MFLPFTLLSSFGVDWRVVPLVFPNGNSLWNMGHRYLRAPANILPVEGQDRGANARTHWSRSNFLKPEFPCRPNVCNRSHSGCSTSPTSGDKHRRVESALDYWCRRVSKMH